MRNGKELLVASRQFASDVPWKSWLYLWTTFALLAALVTLACLQLPWYISLLASVLTGLVLVRAFIIYHDYMHGAILRGSPIASCIMHVYGLLALSPPHIWKHSHDDHHKNNAKTFGPALGTFPVMTAEEYNKATFTQRLSYRVSRHPLAIMMGYLTGFFWSMSLQPLLADPKKHYMAALSIVAHMSVGVGFALISFQALILGFLVPMIIAGAIGTYLFYAQHNFPGVLRRHGDDWDHVYAALHSSSFMKMGKLMHWFTGNIGYHHVHHLNAKIPFYRLPEAMAGIKELQSPPTTSLNPIEVVRCLRLKLWDENADRLLTFREAAQLSAIAR